MQKMESQSKGQSRLHLTSLLCFGFKSFMLGLRNGNQNCICLHQRCKKQSAWINFNSYFHLRFKCSIFPALPIVISPVLQLMPNWAFASSLLLFSFFTFFFLVLYFSFSFHTGSVVLRTVEEFDATRQSSTCNACNPWSSVFRVHFRNIFTGVGSNPPIESMPTSKV